MTTFNEDSRVKIPSILHLCRLGYEYISLKTAKWDTETNIFTDIFKKSISKINPALDEYDIDRLLVDISLSLDNEDLGKADEQVLQNTKLLNNESYFTTEMTRLVVEQFKNDNKITLNAESAKYINNLIVNEYINEFNGRAM